MCEKLRGRLAVVSTRPRARAALVTTASGICFPATSAGPSPMKLRSRSLRKSQSADSATSASSSGTMSCSEGQSHPDASASARSGGEATQRRTSSASRAGA